MAEEVAETYTMSAKYLVAISIGKLRIEITNPSIVSECPLQSELDMHDTFLPTCLT